MLELRPAVAAFAELMESRLQANDHKGGWSDCTFGYLWQRLGEERQELYRALVRRKRSWPEVIHEAVDVANYAMMIADLALSRSPMADIEESGEAPDA